MQRRFACRRSRSGQTYKWSIAPFLRLVAFCALICAPMRAHADAAVTAPDRVVSMNLCTDQLAMLIAEPGQLISVSFLSQQPESSAMPEAAAALPANHGRAEEIFLLEPDVVLASVFTSPATTAMLRRLGFRVETFEPAYSFAEVRANIRRMGLILRRQERAEIVIAEFDAKLADATAPGGGARPRLALYYANSYTAGVGTLADEVVAAAGFKNIAEELGLKGTLKLPLETLMLAKPDVVLGQETARRAPGRAYENYAHPALRLAADRAVMTSFADKYWICGGPFTAEAVRLLSEARGQVASTDE